MAATTLIPIEEYLRTSYRPDRDYVDGELLERNVGEEYHSYLRQEIGTYLGIRKKQWNIQPYTKQRIQVSARGFRIPDICVVLGGRSSDQVLVTPPFLCIEILSKDDTIDSMQERIDDYLKFGVAFVWVVNPRTRRGWVYTTEHAQEARDGIVRAGVIEVPLVELFAG